MGPVLCGLELDVRWHCRCPHNWPDGWCSFDGCHTQPHPVSLAAPDTALHWADHVLCNDGKASPVEPLRGVCPRGQLGCAERLREEEGEGTTADD